MQQDNIDAVELAHNLFMDGTISFVEYVTKLDTLLEQGPRLHSSPTHVLIGGEGRARTQVAPRYQHDCSSCTFLGRLGKADVYCCTSPDSGTSYIFRSSSEGSDYYSSCDFRDKQYKGLAATWENSGDGHELFLRRITAITHCPVAVLNQMEK